MRNRASGTLFKLGASLSTHAKNHIFESIALLPDIKQEKIAQYTITIMIESMREFMKSGLELQKRSSPKYVESAKLLQQASKCADSLLEIDVPGMMIEKKELSEVYAQFASSLKRHAPHLASKEEMVTKSLDLDPSNAIANNLKVDMQLDGYFVTQQQSL